jgi:signal transduction histidine kinase
LRPATDEQPDDERHARDVFDGELASVFVYTLDANGQQLVPATGPISPSQAAASAALTNGSDWRTLSGASGERIRMLTYKVTGSTGTNVLQAVRVLADQDQALNRLLLGLVILGGLSAAILGAASWILAGRSLAPTQQALERQQTFVANASHELRTPLTLIRATAEVTQRGLTDPAEQQQLMKDILTETDHMSRLVDELLLLSRLDAGRLTLEHARFDLGELLAESGRSLSRLADERGVKLNITTTPLSAMGDITRVRQVLLIFVDNALRYTPVNGEIRVSAHEDKRLVRLTVSDTGPGIAPEHLPFVFDRFYRADPARSDRNGGSGLGLAIAKALVEAQHGQVGVESKTGQGTTFWFTLPVN